MNRKTILNLAAVALLLGCGGVAAQIAISGLPSATTPLAGTEVVPIVQGGVTRKVAVSFIGGSAITWPTSGNVVVSNGTNTPASIAPTNGNCVVGSAGAWASLACPGGTAANPTATIGATAVNGSATTYMRSDGAPALPATLPAISGVNLTSLNASNIGSGTVPIANLPVATTVAKGVVQADGTTITISAGVISAAAPSGCTFANPTATIGATAVNGSASTCMRSDGAPALPATLPAVSGVNLTALNATNLGSGTVAAARMPALTGDITTSSGAVATTLATVNSNVGSFTSANITVNAKGLITAAANGAGGGSVTSIAQGNGILLSTAPCINTCTISTTVLQNAQTGTSYPLASTDGGKLVSSNNAAAVAFSLVQANTAGFTAGWGLDVDVIGAGTTTITAATSTFDNALSVLVLAKGQDAYIWSDGANYHSVVSMPLVVNNGMLCNTSGATNYPVSCTFASVWALLTAQNNTWTAAQRASIATVSISTATFTPSFDGSNNFTLTLSSACPCTIANPSTTPVAGQSGVIRILQDGTGSRTVGTWGSQYFAEGGVAALTLSTAANAADYFSYFVFDATHIIVTPGAKNVSH